MAAPERIASERAVLRVFEEVRVNRRRAARIRVRVMQLPVAARLTDLRDERKQRQAREDGRERDRLQQH